MAQRIHLVARTEQEDVYYHEKTVWRIAVFKQVVHLSPTHIRRCPLYPLLISHPGGRASDHFRAGAKSVVGSSPLFSPRPDPPTGREGARVALRQMANGKEFLEITAAVVATATKSL